MVSCHSVATPEALVEETVDKADDSVKRQNYLRYLDVKGEREKPQPVVVQRIDHICQFDALIRAEAAKIGWDWKMLASLIYQESHFKPDLVNEKGAFGLMQLMPVTMEKYGIDYNSSVEEQLAAAGKLLLFFERELSEIIADSLERGNFMLACYNGGLGHILKARTKAEQHGKNPDVWFGNVEDYVHKQTYYFVREITKRYSHYKTVIE